MNHHTTITTLVFVAYFSIIYCIGYLASRRTHSSSAYLLGDRCFNPYITGLAAGASDMSSWLLMGLPGAIYLYGLNHIWMPVGLLIGAYLNWLFVAKRLRIATEKADNALTIPQYLTTRFHDKKNIISLSLAIIMLIFFSVYTAAGFVAFAILISKFFGLKYIYCLVIAVFITMLYVLVGGFIAVNWVDMFQGILMLIALLILPIFMFLQLHGMRNSPLLFTTSSHYFQPLHGMTVIGALSLLGWGLGYFGQPHVLVRFMATKDPETIPMSRRIGISWMFLCLVGAIAVGVFGAMLFNHPSLTNPETVFIDASQLLHSPLLTGILLSALISAIMSTISAQILISSSALVEDITMKIFKLKLSDRTELLLDRGAVIMVTLLAAIIAMNPHSTILGLVAYAWAGLGATLGPVILFSLYWTKTTRSGVACGIIVGGLMSLIWPEIKPCFGSGIGHIFELYSLVPAFLLASLTIYLVSLCTCQERLA